MLYDIDIQYIQLWGMCLCMLWKQEKEPLSVPIYIDPAVTPDPSLNCGSVAAENTELLTSQHMPGKGAVGVNQWRSSGLFTVPCSLSPLTPR
jgi:hypothetical protein